MIRRTTILAAFVSGFALATLGACASSPEKSADDPSAVSNADARTRDRLRAISALDLGGPDGQEHREALRALAWKRSEPADVRIGAINALTAHDPDDAGPMLALMLPTETSWPIIERIGELAVEQDWKQMTPALVRSWSREVDDPADEDRPERTALLALHPGQSDVEIAFNAFASATGEGRYIEKERAGAWSLLMRLTGSDSQTLVGLLEDVTPSPDRPDLAALVQGARTFGVVPRTGEELDTLTQLFTEDRAEFRRLASEAITELSGEQRTGLRVRHIAIVLWASRHAPQWLDESRDALLLEMNDRLRGRSRRERNVGGGGVNVAMERIARWDDQLVWADVLSLLVADEVIQTDGLRRTFFEQADHDKADTSTEHGGAVVADWGSTDSAGADVRAVAYLPRATLRTRDTEFVASTALLRDAPDALFHYHFHAQRFRNGQYAGPSEGDLRYATRFGRACLVLTFLNARELDVDYYQSDGVRVDLGVIRRP